MRQKVGIHQALKLECKCGVGRSERNSRKIYFNQGTTPLNSAGVRKAYYQYKQTGFAKDFNPNLL
jgi:hypothetical protein